MIKQQPSEKAPPCKAGSTGPEEWARPPQLLGKQAQKPKKQWAPTPLRPQLPRSQQGSEFSQVERVQRGLRTQLPVWAPPLTSCFGGDRLHHF